MATSQGFVNFICRRGALEPQWLQMLFLAERQALYEWSEGTAHTTIYFPEVKAFHVCLPPLNEQRRIVAKLDALQAHSRKARAALDRLPALLERFRQSILAAAFRGELTADWRAANPDVEPASTLLERIRAERKVRWIEAEAEKARDRARKRAEKKGQAWTAEDDEKALTAGRKKAEKKYTPPEPVDAEKEGLPELPGGWCWAASAELVDPSTIITYGVVKPGPNVEEGVPYVRGGDVVDGKILVDQLLRMAPDLAAKKPHSSLAEGDVVLCIIRHLRVAIAPAGIDGANLTQGAVRLRPSAAVGPGYLAAYLKSPQAQSWMKSQYIGMAMPRINVADARRVPVPLAPSMEQEEIAQAVERFQEHLSALEAQSTMVGPQLNTLDQAILAKAFRGELVPQDPSDEPAAVLLARIRAEKAAAAPKKKTRRRSKS